MERRLPCKWIPAIEGVCVLGTALLGIWAMADTTRELSSIGLSTPARDLAPRGSKGPAPARSATLVRMPG